MCKEGKFQSLGAVHVKVLATRNVKQSVGELRTAGCKEGCKKIIRFNLDKDSEVVEGFKSD